MEDKGIRDKLREKMDKYKVFIKRYGLLYGVNMGFIVVTIIFIALFESFLPPYEVKYEPEIIQENIISESMLDTVFHYYLDYSPSMEGFLVDTIGSNMMNVSEAIMDINTSGNEKEFFLCADEIIVVSENDMYANMKSNSGIREYYNSFIYNRQTDAEDNEVEFEEMGDDDVEDNELEEKIAQINLAQLFYRQYGENQSYKIGKDSLNVIITDLNFKKNSNDTQGHEALMQEFASELGNKCAKSNIAIYHIVSKFAGITSDEYEMGTDYVTDDEMKSFFIIVESQNDSAYMDFSDRLEEKLEQLNVDCSEKYELINKISNEKNMLSFDLDNLRRNNLITLNNFNYDNESFKNLEDNAIGLRAVNGHGMASIEIYTSPINIIGCNQTDEVSTGDVNIDINAKISYPTRRGHYEEAEETIISSIKCGTVWEQDDLCLNIMMEIDPANIRYDSEGIEKMFQENYLVIELQYFLEKPDYSLPEWIVADEDMQDKVVVYNSIIENKEKTFSDLSRGQKYLGNTMVYITY